MTIKLETFQRKPFQVQAVQVEADNIAEVAEWCGGEIRVSNLSKIGGKEGHQEYIKLEVKNPLNDRQTRAYAGDWVLLAPTGFKIFTPKAFRKDFEKVVEEMLDTVERMEKRAELEDKLEAEQDDGVVKENTVVSTELVVSGMPADISPALVAQMAASRRNLA